MSASVFEPDFLLKWWGGNSTAASRWLKHEEYIRQFRNVNTSFTVVGSSLEGREIREYVWGSGSRGLIAWSQMHGNEATATYALRDVLLFLEEHEDHPRVEYLKRRIHLRFIPMVNPDGAEQWSRRTALKIDPNRDAVAQQCVETRTLYNRIAGSGADVALNLHDQRNIFHLADRSDSAVISFLAPSADQKRSINPTRRSAMNWVSYLQEQLKTIHEPGAAKYTDEFYPTAFGENVQKLNIPTVLIESGAAANDPMRMEARRMNFFLIIKALEALAEPVQLDRFTLSDYESIPLNDNKQWDVLIRNVIIGQDNTKVDIGVRYQFIPNKDSGELETHAFIGDIGDLSQHVALKTIDAEGASFESGKRLPRLDEPATFTLFKGGKSFIDFESRL